LNRFADLIEQVSLSNNERQITELIVAYFAEPCSIEEKTEALKLLLNKKPKRRISIGRLKEQSTAITNLPKWLIERSEHETGNFLKTLSLLLQGELSQASFSISYVVNKFLNINPDDENGITDFFNGLKSFDQSARLLILKLITGTFRSPVPEKAIKNALSQVIELPIPLINLRLHKLSMSYSALKQPVADEACKLPLPFPEIKVIESTEQLGKSSSFTAYGKTKGIRTQLVRHQNVTFLWSEEGQILNDKFQEIMKAAAALPGNLILDGQIISQGQDGLEAVENRLNKKSIPSSDVCASPAAFEIWNQLGPMVQEEDLLLNPELTRIQKIAFSNWEQLKEFHHDCRERKTEGILLMPQNYDNHYYLLKAKPFTIAAYLIYVELGAINNHGLKSVTFGLYDAKRQLLPIAKVDNFGNHIDLLEIINYTQAKTIERFGPVRTVKPELIYELSFDTITKSKRRKSGFILNNVQLIGKPGKTKASPDLIENIGKA